MIGWPNRAWHTEDPGVFMALCPASRESLAMGPGAVCGFSLGGSCSLALHLLRPRH